MKKIIHILLAATMLLSVFLLTACGKKDDVTNQALEYLEHKYEKDTFEISEGPINKSVTGRYELAAQSTDDGVKFNLYVYSLFITDSYSVTKANARAGEKVKSLLNEEVLGAVKEITVYPIYDDGGIDYRFTNLPVDAEDDLTSIDNILLNDVSDTDEVVKSVEGVLNQLKTAGVSLSGVRFTFNYSGYTVSVETDTEFVLALEEDQLKELVDSKVESALTKAKENEKMFAEKTVAVDLNATETETEATDATEPVESENRSKSK